MYSATTTLTENSVITDSLLIGLIRKINIQLLIKHINLAVILFYNSRKNWDESWFMLIFINVIYFLYWENLPEKLKNLYTSQKMQVVILFYCLKIPLI